MDTVAIVVAFLIDLVFSAAFLWVGMRVASSAAGMPDGGQYCGFVDLLKVTAGASLAALIPYIGWALSFVVLFYMLRRVTEAEFRELLIMVVISRVVGVAAVMLLGLAL
jgi:hypothetical protein